MDVGTKEVLSEFRAGIKGLDDKLSVMGSLVTQMAVVQERMVVLQERHSRSEDGMREVNKEIELLKLESRKQEKVIEDNRRSVAMIHKITGAVMLALVGATVKLLVGGV